MKNTAKIYFDNNATTYLQPEVVVCMRGLMKEPLNPSSLHSFGRRARNIVEEVRKKILEKLNASNMRLVFTASGTESNNLALKGLSGYKIITSNIEHPSILNNSHIDMVHISVDKNGLVNLEELDKVLHNEFNLGNEKLLVSVMLANNETGVIEPLKEIVKIAKKYKALVHSDAVQALGKIQLDILDLGLDLITISAHKMGGPVGVAALIFNKNVKLESIIEGGAQEKNYRAGTENVLAIAGWGAAITNLKNEKNIFLEKLRGELETAILQITSQTIICASQVLRLPNTSCILMPNVSGETQLIDFDLNNIAISTGSACSSGKITTSHVLKSMGIEENLAKNAIRVSLGVNNTLDEVVRFIEVWGNLYKRLNK